MIILKLYFIICKFQYFNLSLNSKLKAIPPKQTNNKDVTMEIVVLGMLLKIGSSFYCIKSVVLS